MNAKERMIKLINGNSIKCADLWDQAELLAKLSEGHSKQQEEIFFEVLNDYEDDNLDLYGTITLNSGNWIKIEYMQDSEGEAYSSWTYHEVPKRIFNTSVFSVSFSGRSGELKKVEVFSALAMAKTYIEFLMRDHKLDLECISCAEGRADEYHRFVGGEVVILTEHKL